MKKLLFLILLPLSTYIYAEDTFTLNFNLAAIGVGADFSKHDYNGEFFVKLLYIEVIHKYSNIGIGLSP